MIKINEAIIVEGKYDKIKLSQIVDAVIISVNGFNIFKDSEKQALIKNIAKKSGIILLTDSDRAGFLIRNFICGIVDTKNIRHAYIPQIEGVEKRKDAASKDGFLGVEGVDDRIILESIKKAATVCEKKEEYITKSDFLRLGLAGCPDSKIKRDKLLLSLDLPKGISANAFLKILNSSFSESEINNIINKIKI